MINTYNEEIMCAYVKTMVSTMIKLFFSSINIFINQYIYTISIVNLIYVNGDWQRILLVVFFLFSVPSILWYNRIK